MQKQYVKYTQEKHNMTSLKEKVQLNINNPEFDQSTQAWKKKKTFKRKWNSRHIVLTAFQLLFQQWGGIKPLQ